ncbi:MAG: lysine--tRNA ligase [Candidatus Kerfeldbacteria bacterium]|nr:lysine--tRNA ligase [Candidatus Kerfeldbacteria bacterium]
MSQNHASPIDEYQQRIAKMQELRDLQIDPYPAQSDRTSTVAQFLETFELLAAEQRTQTLTGRIRLKREHGKLTFAHLQDASGKIQLVFSQAELGEDAYAQMNRFFDVADIIQITGTPFLTKKGEQSILVTQPPLMLAKALRPLPEKWKGIQDEETRFRKRYLDMVMNPELREMFVKKSLFWNAMRTFLIDEGFLEIETPILESTPGGADAEPFITHHNALGIDLFLRISVGELWQKRLMVAGFEKTFEIGRVFRNEGMSPEHLQDYTAMEFYWAYADYNDSMKLVERMYKHCIMATFGTLQFSIRGFHINFDTEWGHIDYAQTIQEQLDIDILAASDDEIAAKARTIGMTVEEHANRARLVDSLWKYCRKSIAGPVFLVNHPVDVSPLAKRKGSDARLVERYQIIIAGSEQGNGYSELNDPMDQRARFEEQAKLREAGDTEAQMHDEDFVEALEHGMPPTTGFGVSERLFSFLMDKPIRECVMFPLLRPKQPAMVDSPDTITSATESSDYSLQSFEAGISREHARMWLFQEVKDENLRRHMLATEALMKALARHFGAASPESWGIAGLLHDIDWEKTSMDQHGLVGAEMAKEKNIHPLIVDAIREHNYHHKLEPKTLLSKAMMCLEQLTGLISAATFVQPDKNVHSVKLSSVKKKFKDKGFAKGVDRTMIAKCEELLGLSLDQSIEICLKAMQDSPQE